jgi:hypothetical protein
MTNGVPMARVRDDTNSKDGTGEKVTVCME